jgi:hypothetical protein
MSKDYSAEKIKAVFSKLQELNVSLLALSPMEKEVLTVIIQKQTGNERGVIVLSMFDND